MATKKSTTFGSAADGGHTLLRDALTGHFDKPWAELPATLKDLARSDLWPWWDMRSDPAWRMQLAREADARSNPDGSSAQEAAKREELFNLRSLVRDKERELDEDEPSRDEKIFRDVTALLDARERSVYKKMAAKYGISEGRIRNIVGKRRAELGLQRPRRKAD